MGSNQSKGPANTAVIPASKLEEDFYDWWERHEEVLRIKDEIDPEIVLIGDSITHFWGGQPTSPAVNSTPEAWKTAFGDRRVLNLGFGWDRTQNVLWRLDHGEMDGLHPQAVVINIGTNNTSETEHARANTAAEIRDGLQAIGDRLQILVPHAAVILMAVFPREEQPDHPRRRLIEEINALYAALAAERGWVFLDIGPGLLTPDGILPRSIAGDFCHINAQGYQVWADALHPALQAVFSR